MLAAGSGIKQVPNFTSDAKRRDSLENDSFPREIGERRVFAGILFEKLAVDLKHTLREVEVSMPVANTVPAEEVLGTIQQLRAEINKCNQAIATIATGNIVNFPTDAQIMALQVAVARVSSIALRSATAQQVLGALSALVATFPD